MNLYDKKQAWILGGFEFLRADTTVEADPGSGGASFAADAAAGGELHPYAKMEFGASGTQTPVSTSNPLPVVQTGTPALPTGAATAARQDTGNTSLATLAGAVSGTEMQVDIVASAAIPITDNSGSITIDAASLPLPTGAATAAKQPALGTAGTASADVISIQGIASMTPVQIADNGGSITVDAASLPLPTGAATAANQTTGNTALSAIQTAVEILDNAIAGNEMQVDVLTLPNVTLAAGTNTNEVVGDAAHDAAIAGNPVRLAGRAMSADYTAVASGDTADLLATVNGKLVVKPHALPGESWSYAAAAGGLVSTTGVTAKAAAGAGIRNYITSIQVINSHQTTSTEVVVRDGAAGTVLHRGWAQAAGGGYACEFVPPLRGTANTLVEIAEVSATATAGVLVNLQGFEAEE